jgi:excisionase family DNA binding protein
MSRDAEVEMIHQEELSAVEAARRLGVGLDYLYSLLWTRKLEGRKSGRRWRIPARAVEKRREDVEKACATSSR